MRRRNIYKIAILRGRCDYTLLLCLNALQTRTDLCQIEFLSAVVARDPIAKTTPVVLRTSLQLQCLASTNNAAPKYTTTSMKVFQLGRRVGGSTLVVKNVSILRCHGALAVSYARTPVRCVSSTKEPSEATKWTPHSLNKLQAARLGKDAPSEFPKETPKVHTAYIAFGSNLGDRIGWIEKACKHMSSRGIKIRRTSCLWETEPMYVMDQGSFINGVCEVSRQTKCHSFPGRLYRSDSWTPGGDYTWPYSSFGRPSKHREVTRSEKDYR